MIAVAKTRVHFLNGSEIKNVDLVSHSDLSNVILLIYLVFDCERRKIGLMQEEKRKRDEVPFLQVSFPIVNTAPSIIIIL